MKKTRLLFEERECNLPINSGKIGSVAALISVYISDEIAKVILSNSEDEKNVIIQIILSREELQKFTKAAKSLSFKDSFKIYFQVVITTQIATRKICPISEDGQFLYLAESIAESSITNKYIVQKFKEYTEIVLNLFSDKIESLKENEIF